MRIQDGMENSHDMIKGYMGIPDIHGTHVHNSIELIYVARGHMTELFPIRRHRVESGQLAAFYALIPHRCAERSEDAFVYGMHVPMARFLKWGLPYEFVSRLTHGEVLTADAPDRRLLDETQFRQWMDDMASGDAVRIDTLCAELHGRLRRLALDTATSARDQRKAATSAPPSLRIYEWERKVPPETETHWDKLERMTLFISFNYRENITAIDVAKRVGVHPNYAASLFRGAFDMTITEYITQRRLAYAYRALTETDHKILEIAFDAGFGSARRFHDVFLKEYGQTPASVRKSQSGSNATPDA